ncbi:hypothetical protein U9M48_004658 [Paspalum notatum var. saurae]|uniref:Uncharacterized protein n=1 Tax=Paspalum notatum var. saurae TaxID=547442 RepID=A0AAQ3PKU1_PASNO
MQCARCGGCACGCGAAAGAEALREEVEDTPLIMDLEKGPAAAPTVAAPSDTMAETTRAALMNHHDVEIEQLEVEFERASIRAVKCILRGLIVLPWVYLVDLMRRYVSTLSAEELILAVGPLSIVVLVVSFLFCMLMEGLPMISP